MQNDAGGIFTILLVKSTLTGGRAGYLSFRLKKNSSSNYAGVPHLEGWGCERGAVCCSPGAMTAADETSCYRLAVNVAPERAGDGASVA